MAASEVQLIVLASGCARELTSIVGGLMTACCMLAWLQCSRLPWRD